MAKSFTLKGHPVPPPEDDETLHVGIVGDDTFVETGTEVTAEKCDEQRSERMSQIFRAINKAYKRQLLDSEVISKRLVELFDEYAVLLVERFNYLKELEIKALKRLHPERILVEQALSGSDKKGNRVFSFCGAIKFSQDYSDWFVKADWLLHLWHSRNVPRDDNGYNQLITLLRHLATSVTSSNSQSV